jgi:hypothetical protein
MDRSVSIKLYRVDQKENRGPKFSVTLRDIYNHVLGRREHQVEPDITIRLEKLTEENGLFTGEIVRLQSANLPPKALPAHPVERLGVRSIGHSSVFVYDPQLSVLSIQCARNGISSSRISMYADHFAGGEFYEIWPILNSDTWNKLRRGSIRAMRVRLASPENLEAADDEARTVRQGLRSLKRATETHNLDVNFTMSRGDPDLDRARTVRLFRWFESERQAGRGNVTKLQAKVSDGDETELLNLLGAQMGANTRLDLPDDDPNISYRMRADYTRDVFRANRPALEEQFGN